MKGYFSILCAGWIPIRGCGRITKGLQKRAEWLQKKGRRMAEGKQKDAAKTGCLLSIPE
jgi:hypothetical protein